MFKSMYTMFLIVLVKHFNCPITDMDYGMENDGFYIYEKEIEISDKTNDLIKYIL